jgi:predicted nucleic acid-binding protein
MQLLISDANIFIDLLDGGILEPLFKLPFEFLTPDILYYEELEELHTHLLDMGLQLGALDGKEMELVGHLADQYRGPSRTDCMALVLAQKESCPLLTGDRDLRHAARQEGVLVNGTIWLIEQLLGHKLLTVDEAYLSLEAMEHSGRRLPWKLARERIALTHRELENQK